MTARRAIEPDADGRPPSRAKGWIALLVSVAVLFGGGALAFVFARDAMPLALRLIGYAIPMTYFLVIVRGIMIKGIGLDLLRTEVLAMNAFGVFILTVAAMRFRKRLE